MATVTRAWWRHVTSRRRDAGFTRARNVLRLPPGGVASLDARRLQFESGFKPNKWRLVSTRRPSEMGIAKKTGGVSYAHCRYM